MFRIGFCALSKPACGEGLGATKLYLRQHAGKALGQQEFIYASMRGRLWGNKDLSTSTPACGEGLGATRLLSTPTCGEGLGANRLYLRQHAGKALGRLGFYLRQRAG